MSISYKTTFTEHKMTRTNTITRLYVEKDRAVVVIFLKSIEEE